MNFSEFKKLIGADPLNQDPATLRARESSDEFEAAAAEAEVFEQKLQGAIRLDMPDGLLDDIKSIAQPPAKRRRWAPLAMAASVLIAVGAFTLLRNNAPQYSNVESYLAGHYAHDGAQLVAQASGVVAEQDVARIMASLDATADPLLSGRISVIKYCPTLEGRGAHMVVSTSEGPMTIIFMPGTHVTDGKMVEFDQMHAFLVDLDHGSAAIIGDQSQAVQTLEPVVRQSIKTGVVGA